MGFLELIVVVFIGPLFGAGILLISCKLAQLFASNKPVENGIETPISDGFSDPDFATTREDAWQGDHKNAAFDEKNPYAAATSARGQVLHSSHNMPSFFSAWLIAGICCVAFFVIWFGMYLAFSFITFEDGTVTAAVLLILATLSIPYLCTIVLKAILLARFTKQRIGQVVVPIMIDQALWLIVELPLIGLVFFGVSARV